MKQRRERTSTISSPLSFASSLPLIPSARFTANFTTFFKFGGGLSLILERRPN
jgi:hypothetical protein